MVPPLPRAHILRGRATRNNHSLARSLTQLNSTRSSVRTTRQRPCGPYPHTRSFHSVSTRWFVLTFHNATPSPRSKQRVQQWQSTVPCECAVPRGRRPNERSVQPLSHQLQQYRDALHLVSVQQHLVPIHHVSVPTLLLTLLLHGILRDLAAGMLCGPAA